MINPAPDLEFALESIGILANDLAILVPEAPTAELAKLQSLRRNTGKEPVLLLQILSRQRGEKPKGNALSYKPLKASRAVLNFLLERADACFSSSWLSLAWLRFQLTSLDRLVSCPPSVIVIVTDLEAEQSKHFSDYQ